MLLNADNYTLKLYKHILHSIFKDLPIVIFADKDSEQILKKSHDFRLQKRCNKSTDILVGSNFRNLPKECKNKPLFVTTHREYMSSKNAIGAFYWTKGRPQIHFRKDLFKKYHLELPEDFQRYIDE